MIAFTECPREIAMKEPERCLDPQLWHACAGGMVQMPALSSLVCYFPQGQAEHAQSPVEFPVCPRLPPYILCRVAAVKYLADPDTDEVYAKIKLLPVRSEELDYAVEDLGSNGSAALPEKTASFAKTLTQSDANNGGGFSVPRYCAETIFPRLDYSADPPVQTIMARDVHGEIWKFRHIYRGTPRRHLLTTGWSTFVNHKKLVAGDSIVFLRSESGELCVGIRRAKRGPGGGLELPSGWNIPSGNCLPPSYAGFSLFLREQENKLMRRSDQGGGPIGGRVRAESVIEAAKLAASGQLFEVVYYPRASTPEFCVKAAAVRASLRMDWCAGLRFKMAFETEDSSRISWFMGTVSSVQCADPLRWPDSPWRLLQVTWDEPDLLQNVKRVSPWLVEVVSSMPGIHLKSFSPSRKKLRLPPAPEVGDGRLMAHVFAGGSFEPSSNPHCCLPDSVPSGIQGARHSQFGISISDLQISKLQTGLIRAGFHRPPAPVLFSGVADKNGSTNTSDDVSCLLTIGSAASSPCFSPKTPHFVLFGQPILTETPPSSGEESPKPIKNGGSDLNVAGWYEDKGLDQTGHCKVFLESENVGRTLDLSVLGSYEELYRRLADMFGIHKSDVKCHVLYRDATGAVKHTGDEAFTDFMKTARRLQILMDEGNDNLGR